MTKKTASLYPCWACGGKATLDRNAKKITSEGCGQALRHANIEFMVREWNRMNAPQPKKRPR